MREQYLTVKQVAERLNVVPRTIRNWIARGKLQGEKLPGGDWRITPEAVDVMLEAQRMSG